MHIFNEIRHSYSIPSKILTQMIYIPNIIKIHWKQFKLSSGHQTLVTEHPGSLRKNLKKLVKNTSIEIKQNTELISYLPEMSLIMPSLMALAWKLTSGMPKMPKSHDQPLCAYLMRYDACPSSIPSKILTQVIYIPKKNPMKRIKVMVWTPSTHERAPRLIKKSVKNLWKIQILKELRTYIMCPYKVFCNSKFEGSITWKLTSGMPKMSHTWPAIMRIINEVWNSYSIPSKNFTQVIYMPAKIEIRWKELKLSSGHRQRMGGQADGRMDEQGESSTPAFNFVVGV